MSAPMEMNEERATAILDPEFNETQGIWWFRYAFGWNVKNNCLTFRYHFTPHITENDINALAWWMRNKKGE